MTANAADSRWRLLDANGTQIAEAAPDEFPAASAVGRATIWGLKARDSAGLSSATLVNDARNLRRLLEITVIWPPGTPDVPIELTTPDDAPSPDRATKKGFTPS